MDWLFEMGTCIAVMFMLGGYTFVIYLCYCYILNRRVGWNGIHFSSKAGR